MPVGLVKIVFEAIGAEYQLSCLGKRAKEASANFAKFRQSECTTRKVRYDS